MPVNEPIELKRDCKATQIPIGNLMILPKGSPVKISQSLGGSFTVITEEGYLVRIAGEDADALGLKKSEEPAQVPSGEKSLKELIWQELRTCYDPEIPVNIADLGLIYSCVMTPLPEGGHSVDIKMTLTAPGCGMGGPISAEVQGKVTRLPGVKRVNVELVWEPHWNQSMMSEAAKLQLGML